MHGDAEGGTHLGREEQVVVLVARDDATVDGAQDLGRDGVLVVGDVICGSTGASSQGPAWRRGAQAGHAQLATSFWIWVGVSIQQTVHRSGGRGRESAVMLQSSERVQG